MDSSNYNHKKKPKRLLRFFYALKLEFKSDTKIKAKTAKWRAKFC